MAKTTNKKGQTTASCLQQGVGRAVQTVNDFNLMTAEYPGMQVLYGAVLHFLQVRLIGLGGSVCVIVDSVRDAGCCYLFPC